MITLFRQILETVLFPEGLADSLVLIPELPPDDDQERQESGLFYVPRDLFPNHCEVRELSSGEPFIHAVKNIVSEVQPSRSFIFPPLLSQRHLSDDVRSRFPGRDLQEIALQIAVESLQSGSLVGATLPLNSFSSLGASQFRGHLLQIATPRFVIEHDHPWQKLGFDLHPAFRMQTVILEMGENTDRIVRFFKCPEVAQGERQEIIADLRRLTKRGGGETNYGYVLREGLPPGTVWLFDAHNPALKHRLEDIRYFGDVQRLTDLVEIHHGLHKALHAHLLIENDSDEL